MFGFSENKDYLFYLIDDEKDVLEVLKNLLQDTFSCKVKTFTSTAKALESLTAEVRAPDLIYSDISMGKDSGLCIREKIDNLGANIPVLFVTGLSGPEGFFDGYWSINKPVSVKSLKKFTLALLKKG